MRDGAGRRADRARRRRLRQRPARLVRGRRRRERPDGCGEAEDGSRRQPVEEALSFLPAAIHVAGMPSHRFWEMEDAKVEFGAIDATTTDIAKILLAEFILAYGNDWCVIPYEIEVGELCDALGLVVRDVFGDSVLVRAADRGTDEDWRRWAMFGLETRTGGRSRPPAPVSSAGDARS